MAKIPLSIKTPYLSNWGAYEGVRELIQNARDAEIENDAPMTVEYVNGLLRIQNEGTVLPHQALLLGHTTKLERSDTIGKFGEGLKLGILALVRAGHSVKIRSGNEVWVPSLQWSDLFKADVLTFDITGGRQDKNRVRIEVGGIPESKWMEFKKNFLFLEKPKKNDRIKTYEGTLLLSAEHRCKVFVKGIFVQDVPDLSFGYDLTDAELDRDRRMIESWNLQYKTRSVFMAALSANSELFRQFDSMIETQSPEVQGISHSNVSYSVGQEIVDHVADRFVKEHGPEAVPVQNLQEAQEVEHLGVRGVVVNTQQSAILSRKFGDLFSLKEKLSKEVSGEHSWADLTAEEKNNLSDAISLLDPVVGLGIARVHVVDFRSPNLEGQYKDGHVSIARKMLADPDDTLRVLVHEAAHEDGTDGTRSHFQRVETIWMQILRNVRRTSRFDRT